MNAALSRLTVGLLLPAVVFLLTALGEALRARQPDPGDELTVQAVREWSREAFGLDLEVRASDLGAAPTPSTAADLTDAELEAVVHALTKGRL